MSWFSNMILHVAMSLGKKANSFEYLLLVFYEENNSISVFKPLASICNTFVNLFQGYCNILLLLIFQAVII